jgi:hypothetical protein
MSNASQNCRLLLSRSQKMHKNVMLRQCRLPNVLHTMVWRTLSGSLWNQSTIVRGQKVPLLSWVTDPFYRITQGL